MKIKNIDALYGDLKNIPKAGIESINSQTLQESFSTMLEHSSLIGGDEIALGETILQGSEHIDNGIPILSIISRIGYPIKDIRQGNYLPAIKRTAVNLVDVAIYKARLVYGGLGALRGLIVKWRGAETPDAGFINGFKYAMRHWQKGRKNVENALISPMQFMENLVNDPLKAQYEKYHEEREAWLNKHRNAILDNSEKSRLGIDNWGKNWLQYLNTAQNQLNQMIARENCFQQVYYQERANCELTNSELIYKLETLKTLQRNLYTDCNNFINEVKTMITSLPDESKNKKVLSDIADFSSIYYKEKTDSINKTISLANKILKLNEILYRKTSQKGFDRIAGYDDLKQTLIKKFISPVAHFATNKKQTLPNVILLYGPKGCGKTLFAHALIDETKSNVIKLELALDSGNDFKNLQEAISQARNTYISKGAYTIIHIDEIDGFLSDKTYQSDETKNLIQSLSDNYCTIIATTNYPEKVNTCIVSGEGVEKFYVGPPDKKNIQEVLKYYINDLTDFKIDYQSLINILHGKMNDNLYSNAKIAESIIYALKKALSKTDNELNQQYFEGIIAKIEPDITESNMKHYKGKDAL